MQPSTLRTQGRHSSSRETRSGGTAAMFTDPSPCVTRAESVPHHSRQVKPLSRALFKMANQSHYCLFHVSPWRQVLRWVFKLLERAWANTPHTHDSHFSGATLSFLGYCCASALLSHLLYFHMFVLTGLAPKSSFLSPLLIYMKPHLQWPERTQE